MKFIKKCTVIFLTICILVSTCACRAMSSIVNLPNAPHMSERVYERLDADAAFALIDEIAELCKSKENLDLVIEKRGQFFTEYYNKLSILTTIASINYDKNIYDEYWRNESVWIDNFSQELHKSGIELEKIIFNSPCVDYFVEEYGQDYVDIILGVETFTDEQLQLMATISELESQYMPLYYSEDRSIEKMAQLLKALVVNRNALARSFKDSNGEYYENYLDYAYEINYGRDYTPDETFVYRAAMKENMYSLADEAFEYYRKYYPGNYNSATITDKQLEQYMPEIITDTIPEMIFSWEYMIDNGLYDFTYSNTKASSSYVTSFSDYGDAFMFVDTTTNFIRDIGTTVHEFGHYNEVFMSKDELMDEKAWHSYDLSETHSQAFELLTLPAVENVCLKYYPSQIGLYQAYSINLIFNSLWSMLSGCAVDSFEYLIYNADEDELTTEFFRQNFLEGVKYYFPIKSNYEFPDISHIFLSPGYYISYSVSMALSYIIWSSDDPIDNYISVVQYGSNNYLSTVCEANNLAYPFDPATIKVVAGAIKEYNDKTFA